MTTSDLTGRFIDLLRCRTDIVRTPEVREATALHILDTLAAVISGRTMPVGDFAEAWRANHGHPGPSSCVGHPYRQDPEAAAFVNALCAHADESDDSHEPSRTHPGASIVPATIAVAEEVGASAQSLLDAVAIGYEACALINWLLWGAGTLRGHRAVSPHAMGGLWGSALATGTLYGFDDQHMRSLVGFTAQLAGGLGTWLRDSHHVEKAFAFAAMPASNGIRAAGLVRAGWPGVTDAFDGSPNFFQAFGSEADESALECAAAGRAVVLDTNIKKYCVGSPAQAAVQAVESLIADGLSGDHIARVDCYLPTELALVVDRKKMADINVQYLVAATLALGTCTFATAHDATGAARSDVAKLLHVTHLVADDTMEPIRQARVEITLHNGQTLRKAVRTVRGTKENPMTRAEVEAKALDLISLGLPQDVSAGLIAACTDPDTRSLPRIGQALRSVQGETLITR